MDVTVEMEGTPVVLTARMVARATVRELAREMRLAIRGRSGYRTLWPRRRGTKAVRARRAATGEKASITQWRVTPRFRRSGAVIEVLQRTRHGALLESRQTIRGYANVHVGQAVATYRANWDRMVAAARASAVRRARSDAIRHRKTVQFHSR